MNISLLILPSITGHVVCSVEPRSAMDLFNSSWSVSAVLTSLGGVVFLQPVRQMEAIAKTKTKAKKDVKIFFIFLLLTKNIFQFMSIVL